MQKGQFSLQHHFVEGETKETYCVSLVSRNNEISEAVMVSGCSSQNKFKHKINS